MPEKERKHLKLFSQEEITQAMNVDMVSFLETHGTGTFVGSGRYPKYHINGHDSIVIDRKKNYFFHNASHRGDNIIAFLQDYEGYSFPQAVSVLLGKEHEQHVVFDEKNEPRIPYNHPHEESNSIHRVETYLKEVRGIDGEIVQFLFDHGYLIEDTHYHNAVFQWLEKGLPNGTIVGSTSLTTPQTVQHYPHYGAKKYIAEQSKKNYGFSITLGSPKKMFFFESHVDLLSYWSMNKQISDTQLICLEGAKRGVVYSFLQENAVHFNQLPEEGLFYGVDNDATGHRFFDFVDAHVNIAVGESYASNIPLIPFTNQIQQTTFKLYKEVSENYLNVSWDMLATIHKIETNASSTNKLANDYNMRGFFAADSPSEKATDIDILSSLHSVAEAIEKQELVKETLAQLYTIDEPNERIHYFMNEKMKKTLAMYEEGNYKVVESVGKDWDQFLKQEQRKGLRTEHVPLRANEQVKDWLAKDIHPHFTYSLQDAPSKEKINELLVDSFGIHPSIVSTLVKKGFIRQDSNDRIVYLWNDAGIVVGGQLRGTFLDKKAFGRKGYEEAIMNHSRKGYGFNVTLGKPNSIHFFQTPEDLLGYWSLTIDQQTTR